MEQRRDLDNQALLSDWDSLKSWIEATYSQVTCHAEELLRFHATTPQSEAWLRARPIGDLDWVYFMVKVCREPEVNPTLVLYRSAVTRIGSYALYNEHVIVGERLPFAGLTSALVEKVIATLIAERDLALRVIAHGPETPDQELFSHLAE